MRASYFLVLFFLVGSLTNVSAIVASFDDCGNDLDCFATAAENCELAGLDKMIVTGQGENIINVTVYHYELFGYDGLECIFAQRLDSISVEFSDAYKSQLILQGGPDITEQEIDQMEQEANASAQNSIGRAYKCGFEQETLANMLTQWKESGVDDAHLQSNDCGTTEFVNVKVKVIDSNNEAIEGANVVVTVLDYEYGFTSNFDGETDLLELLEGLEFSVFVNLEGYEEKEATGLTVSSVGEGHLIKVNLVSEGVEPKVHEGMFVQDELVLGIGESCEDIGYINAGNFLDWQGNEIPYCVKLAELEAGLNFVKHSYLLEIKDNVLGCPEDAEDKGFFGGGADGSVQVKLCVERVIVKSGGQIFVIDTSIGEDCDEGFIETSSIETANGVLYHCQMLGLAGAVEESEEIEDEQTCTVSELKWVDENGNEIDEAAGWAEDGMPPAGDVVYLSFTRTPGCADKNINLEVWEDDGFKIFDDFQDRLEYDLNFAFALWEPIRGRDWGFGGQREYYFKLLVDGEVVSADGEELISGLLIVKKAECDSGHLDACTSGNSCERAGGVFEDGECLSPEGEREVIIHIVDEDGDDLSGVIIEMGRRTAENSLPFFEDTTDEEGIVEPGTFKVDGEHYYILIEKENYFTKSFRRKVPAGVGVHTFEFSMERKEDAPEEVEMFEYSWSGEDLVNILTGNDCLKDEFGVGITPIEVICAKIGNQDGDLIEWRGGQIEHSDHPGMCDEDEAMVGFGLANPVRCYEMEINGKVLTWSEQTEPKEKCAQGEIGVGRTADMVICGVLQQPE